MKKRFFKKSDVADILKIPETTIAYWERNIPVLRKKISHRTNGGHRLYTQENILLFREIIRLSEKEFSLERIDKILSGKESEDSDTNIVEIKHKAQIKIEEAIGKLKELQKLILAKQ